MKDINYLPQTEQEFQKTLSFVKTSPMVKDYWQVFKKLYKTIEQAFLNDDKSLSSKFSTSLLSHLIYRLDQAKVEDLRSPYPTQATLRYMKRRCRRFLKKVTINHPEMYTQLAQSILIANTGKKELDFRNQWVTLDILYGSSRRIYQKSHGQGIYAYQANIFQRIHSEERHPKIWDNQINWVSSLLEQDLPWEIYEFALKVLERNQIQIPKIKEEILIHFFQSPSTLLKSKAVRLTYQLFTFQNIKAENYAGLWFYANPSLRRKVLEIREMRSSFSKKWKNRFHISLASFVRQELKMGNTQRRVLRDLEFLQKTAPESLIGDRQENLKIAKTLLQSSHQSLQSYGLQLAKKAKKPDVLLWLDAFGTEITESKTQLFKKLKPVFAPLFYNRNKKTNFYEIKPFVWNENFYTADFGWHLAINISYHYHLYQLWNPLLNFYYKRRIKREYFINAIRSEEGVINFMSYYNRGYHLRNLSSEAMEVIFEFGQQNLQDFIINTYAKNFRENPINELHYLKRLPAVWRDKIFYDSLSDFKNKRNFVNGWQIRSIFRQAIHDEWILKATFELLAISQITENDASLILSHVEGATQLVEKLFEILPKLKTEKQEIFLKGVGKNLQFIQNYASKIQAEFLKEIFNQIDRANLVNLISKANQESWEALKDLVYEKMSLEEVEAGFWKGIIERVLESQDRILNERLLQNEQFYALFQVQADETILDIKYPEFEEVVLGWCTRQENLFTMESANLYKVATHKLASIRNWGLQKAKSLGITPIFALQLVESGIPETIATGEDYFNSLTPYSEKELEAALTLIDSPTKEVRTFGMDFLAMRKSHFKDQAEILAFLSEHSDSTVLDFVAENITASEETQKAEFVPKFDKEVLRMTNRNRKAKEKIKARVQESLNISSETLLEMTKSGTKKDAEWAVVQLTKKVLAGENVEGFVLE